MIRRSFISSLAISVLALPAVATSAHAIDGLSRVDQEIALSRGTGGGSQLAINKPGQAGATRNQQERQFFDADIDAGLSGHRQGGLSRIQREVLRSGGSN